MPNTARQRWIVTATWDADDTEPSSYTFKQLDPVGRALNAEAVAAIDLSDAGMIVVVFPAAIDAAAITLKFKDAPTIDGTYGSYAQDPAGDDIAVTGVQSSLGVSRSIDLSICSRFFIKPVFIDVGGDPVEPGAVTVTFMIKE